MEDVVSVKQIYPKGPKRLIATPSIRKMARENHLNIDEIRGTGPRGRITKEDIIYSVERSKHTVQQENIVDSSYLHPFLRQTEMHTETDRVHARSLQQCQPFHRRADEVISFRDINQAVMEQMKKTDSTIPHVTTFVEIDVTNMLHHQHQLQRTGVDISRAAFLLKALIIALQDYRIFNARLHEEDERIEQHSSYHIGLMTHRSKDYVTGVFHHANTKTVSELDKEMNELTNHAYLTQFHAQDRQEATFTMIDNGALGGIQTTPFIQDSQTAILTLYQITNQPRVIEDDKVISRSIMPISFSYDPRVADEHDATAFINLFKSMVEQVDPLIVQHL